MIDYYDQRLWETRKSNPFYEQVAKLRLDFVDKNILSVNTESYPTQVERDWSYLVKREYRYKVTINSIGRAFFPGMVGSILLTYYRQRLNLLPFVISIPCYIYLRDKHRKMFNKRLFDMCNVGEEFGLGRQRNTILRQCNKIQDVEDF